MEKIPGYRFVGWVCKNLTFALGWAQNIKDIKTGNPNTFLIYVIRIISLQSNSSNLEIQGYCKTTLFLIYRRSRRVTCYTRQFLIVPRGNKNYNHELVVHFKARNGVYVFQIVLVYNTTFATMVNILSRTPVSVESQISYLFSVNWNRSVSNSQLSNRNV